MTMIRFLSHSVVAIAATCSGCATGPAYASNRAGSTPFDQDIYVATRASTSAPWSAPQRIDNPSINTHGSETRASLSGDGKRLYFGRKTSLGDPGDIFMSTRSTR